MNIVKTEINIGLKKSISFMHITDTHLTLVDTRDDKRKIDLAEHRSKIFPNNVKLLSEQEKLAKEQGLTIVHTGDLIDFVSESNLERAKKFIDENDVFFAAGNHEFSLYVGEAFEDEAYRNQSLFHVQESFKNNIRFSVREIGGVNFVAIDNSYSLYDEEQYDRFKKVIEADKPIILFIHNPMYEKAFYDVSMAKNSSAFLVAVPDDLMEFYSKDRRNQQKANEITIKMTELVKSCPLVKAIFAGHMHFDYEGYLTDSIKQYVSGIDTTRIVTIK